MTDELISEAPENLKKSVVITEPPIIPGGDIDATLEDRVRLLEEAMLARKQDHKNVVQDLHLLWLKFYTPETHDLVGNPHDAPKGLVERLTDIEARLKELKDG